MNSIYKSFRKRRHKSEFSHTLSPRKRRRKKTKGSEGRGETAQTEQWKAENKLKMKIVLRMRK